MSIASTPQREGRLVKPEARGLINSCRTGFETSSFRTGWTLPAWGGVRKTFFVRGRKRMSASEETLTNMGQGAGVSEEAGGQSGSSVNVGQTERWVSAVGGGALAL